MKDQLLRDSTYAVQVFIISVAILLLGASLELNAWPAQHLIHTAQNISVKGFFTVINSYGLVLIILFWGSRPSQFAQRTVMFCWPVVSILLWHKLDNEMHFFAFASAGNAATTSLLSLLTVGLAIPSTIMLVIRLLPSTPKNADSVFEARLRYLVYLVFLFMIVPESALSFTAVLHPLTFDIYALRFDVSAGLNITPWLVSVVESMPAMPQLVQLAYVMTPLSFIALALCHLRGKPSHVASGVFTWVVLTVCALIAYNFFPVTGPKYIFGSNGFVDAIRNAANLPIQRVGVGPYPRNAMPSMHFGWMLTASILWWRSGSTWWSRAILIAATVLTAIATLYIGEHYVVDLIVAVPFVLAAIALCTTAVPFSAAPRYRVIFLGFGTWIVWILILRTSIQGLISYPWISWGMIIATVIVVTLQAYWMCRFSAYVNIEPVGEIPNTGNAMQVRLERRLGLMFFASGVAALVYQVLFAKQLALVFGSTATATFTVLATFLGGMAIGSLCGSRIALRAKRPLVLYAFVELLIAGYCVLTPVLFDLIQHAYVALASGYEPDAPILLGLRVVLGAIVLLIPTVLMGATLPLLTQTLSIKAERLGTKIAWLYFVNTAGAAVGALATSYFVIPLVGVSSTTLIAALFNLLVALGALELAKHVNLWHQTPSDEKYQTHVGSFPKKASIAALLSLAIAGVLSLGLEVVYVHMLSIVAGNSVYAFGLMLATFLLGLAGGGETARRLLSNPNRDRIQLLVWALLGLATTVALSVWWWNNIPEYFASFAQYPMARSFVAREAIRGIVCALLMIPPTLFIGAAYALGMDVVTATKNKNPVAMLGIGAALNTLGNITGVLLFGFVLLPLFGGLVTTQIIALLALALAAAVGFMSMRKIRRPDLALFAGTTAMIVASFFTHLNYDTLSSGANVYFFPQSWGKVIDHAESIDGGLTTVAISPNGSPPIKTLLTNGKFQGNDAWKGEMPAQIGFALAPLLHQEQRNRALVIGYGTGVTSRVFHEAGFQHLDIAELSRDVVRLADTHFATVNKKVSSSPGVKLHVTDGRNLLLLSSPQNKYDIVSIEITSIWFAGAASLYNREFYSLVRSRLAADGVLQQWVQLHRLAPTDILSVISSLRAEFQYVSLYVIGNQGILIATNSSARKNPSAEAMRVLENTAGLQTVRSILERPLSEIAADRLLDSNGVDRFVKEFGIDERIWWSTDDNLSLEYSTPKANVNDSAKSYASNFELLSNFK